MTEVFEISSQFSDASRRIITEALKKSHLPENVCVLYDEGEAKTAQKPFVVISHSPDWKESRAVMLAGATTYIAFDVNPELLAQKLDGER